MDFFQSLNSVITNRKTLDEWETKQHDKEEKRRAYQKVHEPTTEEVEHAKNLGETLINAIDIMDNHSESIAENVETATEKLGTLTMLAGMIIPGWLSYKLAVKPAEEAIRQAKENFDKNENNRQLIQEINENAHSRWYNGRKEKANLYVSDLRRNPKYSHINDIVESEWRKKALKVNNEFQKSIKKHQRKWWWLLSIPVGTLAGWALGNIWGTKLEVNSSRVARYQARQALKDPKCFVNYTDEQIEQAKENLKNQPKKRRKEKDNLKTGFFSGIFSVIKDNRAYKNDKKVRENTSKLPDRPLTSDELLQAEKDQEVIQRVVKKLNNEAEKNAENMEVAAAVIMGAFPVISTGIGSLLGWIFEKTGFLDKKIREYLQKHSTTEVQEAFEKLSKMKPGDKGYKIATIDFGKKVAEDIAKNGDKLTVKQKIMKPVISALANKRVAKWAIGGAAGIIAIIPSALIALKLEKSASRAGRYTAKRELEKDPRNFIGYSETELDEVKDVKDTEKHESKAKEYIMFLPRVLKQYFNYKKYRKTEYAQKRALNKELYKLEVSDKQLKDAKNLQNKVFNTFEVVDEKSQSYSEATEAATEILQPLVYGAGITAILTPLIIGGVTIAKARNNPGKITNKITKFISKRTRILKSRLAKWYLKGVDKNVGQVVANQSPKTQILKGTFGGMSLTETPVFDLITKLPKNLRESISKELHGATIEKQNEFLHGLTKDLETLKNTPYLDKYFNNVGFDKAVANIDDFKWRLLSIKDAETRAAVFDVIMGKTKGMSEQRVNQVKEIMAEKGIDSRFGEFLSMFEEYTSQEIMPKVQQFMAQAGITKPQATIKDIGEKGEAIIKLFGEMTDKQILKSFDDPKVLIESISQKIEKMNDDDFYDLIMRTPFKQFTKEQCQNSLKDIAKVWENIPKEECQKIFDTMLKEFNEKPDNFVRMVKDGKIKDIFATPQIKRALAIAGVSWTAFTAVMTFVVESWLAEMQLRAGRLGVKMAMDDLKDPAYYANVA